VRYDLAWGPTRPTLAIEYVLEGGARREVVPLTPTPCNYGGARWWASCPNCNRRVAVLWGAPWLCRACHGLAYRSSQRSKGNRALDRGWDLRERFGPEDEDDCGELFDPPERPKGMHRRTYERLCIRLDDAEDRMWDYLRSRFSARMRGRGRGEY